ncbi:MAG: molecular chaperone [Alphaproteobacteria bacterium]
MTGGLARADLLLLAAHVLARPDARLLALLADAAADADALVHRAEVDTALAPALRELAAAARRADPILWRSEHARLFDVPATCPVSESAYIRRDKGALLGDVAGFYRAIGFTLGDGIGEKVDHVAAELEFVAMLLVLMARAEAEGHAEAKEVTRAALKAFATDHLGAWAGAFCRRLGEVAGLDYYRRTAAFVGAVWDEVRRVEGLPEPLGDPTGPVPELGTPYECELAQARRS